MKRIALTLLASAIIGGCAVIDTPSGHRTCLVTAQDFDDCMRSGKEEFEAARQYKERQERKRIEDAKAAEEKAIADAERDRRFKEFVRWSKTHPNEMRAIDRAANESAWRKWRYGCGGIGMVPAPHTPEVCVSPYMIPY